MKIYIAGPMRGYKDYNFPAFAEADKVLRLEGWETINPAALDIEEGFDTKRCDSTITKKELEEFIVRDIHLVLSADAICMLHGWETSKGAVVECSLAQYAGIPVYLIDQYGKVSRPE